MKNFAYKLERSLALGWFCLLFVMLAFLALAMCTKADAADQWVPEELQDIWCAQRLRIGGNIEAKCFRFGSDSLTVEGDQVDQFWVSTDRDDNYVVEYRFADVHYFKLITKHRNYVMVRNAVSGTTPAGARWGKAVRYVRGNPYAEYYDDDDK